MIRWLRDRVEMAAIWLLTRLARLLPVRPTVRLGEWLGVAVSYVDRRRRAVALANLELAYRDQLSVAERHAMVRGVYRHLGRFLFEYLLLKTREDLRPFSRFLEFEGEMDAARQAVARHGSAIFVTLHQGHWEILGGAASEQLTKIHAVMQPIRNRELNTKVVELRGELGIGLINRRQAVPALFRHLRRNLSIAMLCDLNQKEGPAFVDFFGVPAATVRTPALLAIRTGKPMICGTSWSTGEPLCYRGRVEAPIEPRPDADPKEEERRLLELMNAHLESFVRAHPEQWNWIHPRWKTRPPVAASDVATR